MRSNDQLATYANSTSRIIRVDAEDREMSYTLMTCNIHAVTDTTHAWVTNETAGVVSFWYNPSSMMTMRDVVDTIESSLVVRVRSVAVRGIVIRHGDLQNHAAADHVKDGESFNYHLRLVPYSCTLL